VSEKPKSMFTCYQYRAPKHVNVGFSSGVGFTCQVQPLLYCWRARKALPNRNNLGLLRPNVRIHYERVNYQYLVNVPLSGGHWVIDITNGHFIHAGPLEGTIVSIYLPHQCLGRIMGILGQDPNVAKCNRLHVHIFQFLVS
jgi:hypothetical protein